MQSDREYKGLREMVSIIREGDLIYVMGESFKPFYLNPNAGDAYRFLDEALRAKGK